MNKAKGEAVSRTMSQLVKLVADSETMVVT